MDKLEKLLLETSAESRIHFEMASFADEDCLRDVIETVVYHSDSLGRINSPLTPILVFISNHSIVKLFREALSWCVLAGHLFRVLH